MQEVSAVIALARPCTTRVAQIVDALHARHRATGPVQQPNTALRLLFKCPLTYSSVNFTMAAASHLQLLLHVCVAVPDLCGCEFEQV